MAEQGNHWDEDFSNEEVAERHAELMQAYKADVIHFWKHEFPLLAAIVVVIGTVLILAIRHLYPAAFEEADAMRWLICLAMVIVGVYMLFASPYPARPTEDEAAQALMYNKIAQTLRDQRRH